MPFDAQALRDAARDSDEAPPDGVYDAELIDSKIITANSDGRAWLLLSWKALAGAQRDESWDSWHTIDQYDKRGEPNQGLAITVQMLEAMGVDTQDVRNDVDLSGAVRTKHGHGYSVEVKRKPPFTNTYVKGYLLGAQAPAAPVAAPAQQTLGGSNYGQPPAGSSSRAPANAIYGAGDAPPRSPSLGEQAQQAREPVKTGESDVTPANAGDDFKTPPADDDDDVPWETHEPPKKGDTNPDTGDPFLY